MIVKTTGTFDTPHAGHAAFLRQATRFGDLHVGVLSDAFVTNYKGEAPMFHEGERVTLIRKMGYKAHIIDDQRNFFLWNPKANVIAVGSDWAKKDYYAQIDMTQDEMDFNDITLVYVPYTYGISTSLIKKRMR